MDKEVKEITVQDENYLYIRVTNVKGLGNQKEVELITRRKDDKTNDILDRARELSK